MKKRYIYAAYICLLLASYLYVDHVVSTDAITVSQQDDEDKEVETIKPVRVTLLIETQSYKQQYVKRVFSNNSIQDVLKTLRAEEGFSFEKIGYIYGTELDYINGIKAPEGFRWALFDKSVDVTYLLDELHVKPAAGEEKEYTLRLIQT